MPNSFSHSQTYPLAAWLPTTAREVKKRDWDVLDVILFTGDAYVDHPAFGAAVIGRVLEAMGLRVAIVPQPNWQDDGRDFRKLGRPRLFFGITAGAMDSMVNHYTANKRLRSDDAYSPAGEAGFRPDRATVVYSRLVKKFFPDVPLLIGGIEASMRRFTHYDYWDDQLKASILLDSQADLLVYGMGEQPVCEIARLLQRGVPISNLTSIAQTAFITLGADLPKASSKWQLEYLYSHEDCLKSKEKFADNFRRIETEANRLSDKVLMQKLGDRVLVVNPPFPAPDTNALDQIYALPFTRLPHPRYNKRPPIPAYTMIRHSVVSHRGCFGGCSFCTIAAHQGKQVLSRSEASVIQEVDRICRMPDFKGHITDVGGPSANMYAMSGIDKSLCEVCKRASCSFPKRCNNLNTSHKDLLKLYKQVRKHPQVKQLSIGSGLRHDLFFDEKNGQYILKEADYVELLLKHHVSGRLKLAPEHSQKQVLDTMRKPSFAYFSAFMRLFARLEKKAGRRQQVIPYFISSHPGCRLEDMAALAIKSKELNFRLEQVQDFTPTPMTLSTVMFYTGMNPYTHELIETPKNQKDKQKQREFFFWYKPEKRRSIKETLKQIGRMDLLKALFEK